MTTPFGYQDFVQKGSGGLDFLTVIAVNTAGVQSTDITSLVLPSYGGLLIAWQASLASLGQAIQVAVNGSVNLTSLVPTTMLLDGTDGVFPFVGALVTSVAGTVCTVTAQALAGDPTPVSGNLIVMGINNPSITNPQQRRALIGLGGTTGAISVAAGATTTILAAPRTGTYYRLKLLSWSHSTAGAGVTAPQWQALTTHSVMATTEDIVAGGNQSQIPLDIQWDDGVELHNPASVAIAGVVLFETWRI